MWKLIVGFIAFAALALFVISQGGDSLDMSGEKHGTETHTTEPAASATEAASAADAASATGAASAVEAASGASR